jgi:hypothetical protein
VNRNNSIVFPIDARIIMPPLIQRTTNASDSNDSDDGGDDEDGVILTSESSFDDLGGAAKQQQPQQQQPEPQQPEPQQQPQHEEQILLESLTEADKTTLQSRYKAIGVGGFEGVKLERKNDGVHPQDQHLQLAHASNELQSTCRDLLDSVKHYQTVTEGMSAEDRFRQVYRLDKTPETQIDERDTFQTETFEQQTRFLKEYAPLFKKEKEELKSNLLVGVSHENLVATTAAVLIKAAQGIMGALSQCKFSDQGPYLNMVTPLERKHSNRLWALWDSLARNGRATRALNFFFSS